jgi:glutamyl-tRNA synthetase
MQVRDRYAPSPTGLQHIGGIRTALFNYLFAAETSGTFVLRLEDTDRSRFDPSFVANLYDTFHWLGFSWKEGPDIGGPYAPYIQSERTALYQKYAADLVDKGQAYYCFCTPERLEAVRKEREAAHSSAVGYDRHCRTIPPAEAAARAATEPHTIRLKIPVDEITRFHDDILGDIEWKNNAVNADPVLLKSDGFPTYHLANVVDDHLMGITHVLRAQEWLASTPLHVLLYKAFGWTPPEFCHLPMVMGKDGKKLSKRHGSTSIDEFRKDGFLPEALINYIAQLGASWDEGREIYSLKELAERFRLEHLNKAPSVFDYKKLEWYNAQYIRAMDNAALAERALPFAAELFAGEKPTTQELALFTNAMALVKERATFLTEIPAKLNYLFHAPQIPAQNEFFPKKGGIEDARKALEAACNIIETMAGEDDEPAENLAKATATDIGMKIGDFLMPLRVATTGARVSPPLFGSLRLLGADESTRRVRVSLEALTS